MISIYQLKPRFQQLLRPLVHRLAKSGVTANQVTVLAMLLSVLTGVVLVLIGKPAALLSLPAILLLRMALNAIDGMLAREYDQQSTLGAYLNEIGDVISDVFLIVPLMVIPEINLWLLAGFGLTAILTEFAGVLAATVGAERQYQGPMGKSDRALVIGLVGLAAPFMVFDSVYWAGLLLLLIGLSLWTLVNRIRAVVNH